MARTVGLPVGETTEPANPSLYSGYLWRQEGQATSDAKNKHWVRRWFSLRPDHCLYYYKTEAVIESNLSLYILNVHNISYSKIVFFLFRILNRLVQFY